MYRFRANRNKIITDAKLYGITIVLVENELANGSLQFSGDHTGSDSVCKWLTRRMKTYNDHSEKGF